MQKAAEAGEAQESIGLLKDAILLMRERIATGNKALGTHPISFRGSRGNVEKESLGDEPGRGQWRGKAL